MSESVEVLCAGIVVADHVCTPVPHCGRRRAVMADGMLLTIGGCAANAAVDLARMGVRAAIVGRVGADVFGRVVTDLCARRALDVPFSAIPPPVPQTASTQAQIRLS